MCWRWVFGWWRFVCLCWCHLSFISIVFVVKIWLGSVLIVLRLTRKMYYHKKLIDMITVTDDWKSKHSLMMFSLIQLILGIWSNKQGMKLLSFAINMDMKCPWMSWLDGTFLHIFVSLSCRLVLNMLIVEDHFQLLFEVHKMVTSPVTVDSETFFWVHFIIEVLLLWYVCYVWWMNSCWIWFPCQLASSILKGLIFILSYLLLMASMTWVS